jgi:hypothetical protein
MSASGDKADAAALLALLGSQALLFSIPQLLRPPITIEPGVIFEAKPTHSFDPFDYRIFIRSNRCRPTVCYE